LRPRRCAVRRAATNTGELLENLHGIVHRLRQAGIDKQLFSAITGFDVLRRAWRTAL